MSCKARGSRDWVDTVPDRITLVGTPHATRRKALGIIPRPVTQHETDLRTTKAGPSVTNPFEQNVPQQQMQAAPNPFSAPAPQQQAAPNPFGQAVPQQAPQAYAPAPQQQYPAGYPAAQPQQYAPQTTAPQAYAPAPQQAAPPMINPAALQAAAPPPPAGDGKGAKLVNMYGRLVIMFPLSFEVRAKNEKYITPQDRAAGTVTQEQITATVVVLDDGRGGMAPVTWGGDPSRNEPDTDSAPMPYVRKAMWIGQSRIITQLKPHLPATPGAASGLVIGRLRRAGNESNSPWYLTSDVTEAEIALGRAYLDLVAQGRYPHPLAA